ncbi:MAG: photosystem II stability/assembly factor-like protein [Alphaproteobacteria bacterium]|nr:photosystem II stability/assembly factor-like protein [Alphaproteobacteria bacterium]
MGRRARIAALGRHMVSPLRASLLCLLCVAAGAAAAGAEPRLLRQGTPHEALYAVAFDGVDGIAVGALGAVLQTRDAGATWSQTDSAPTDLTLLAAAMRGDTRLVVGQLGKAFRAIGSGAWEEVDTGTQNRLLAVAYVTSGVAVAAGGFGTLIRSSDGGRTWASVAPDWPTIIGDDFEPHLYDIAVLDDGNVLCIGEFGLILRSRDQGLTWETVHKGEASLFGIAVEGARGLAVGQDGAVLRSDDGGATWRSVSSGLDGILLDVWLSGAEAVLVGVRNAATSRDGGQTWTQTSEAGLAQGWHQAIGAPRRGTEAKPVPVTVGHAGRILAFDEQQEGPR